MKILLLALCLALTPTTFASIWYVDGVNGNDQNNCKTHQTACKTIGHAISLASSGDTIGVGPATYTENLTISISLTIIGSGAPTTIIDGGGTATVVTIDGEANVTLSNFTIQHGLATSGAGIYNEGTLTINTSALSGNTATSRGGGVDNFGHLTINNSTIRDNTAFFCRPFCLGNGGGVANDSGHTVTSTLTISNSTISGNTSGVEGGGAIFDAGLSLVISNSTIDGNSARLGGGGGIYIVSSLLATIQNSIVTNNSGQNCIGSLTSNGYNLSSDGTCNFSGPGDLNNTDPKLGTLGNYGGSTQTIPLLNGSPAIDAGNPNGCTDGNGHLLKTDQRGYPRPDKEDTGGCDMGAFEKQID